MSRSHRIPQVLAAATAFAVLHSLLAAHPVKRLARRLLGVRLDRGLYRLGYIVQATWTTAAFLRWFQRLPDRDVYRVRPPWSWLLRLAQIAALATVLAAVRVVGFSRFLGLSQTIFLLRGRMPPPTPEAQGPAPGLDGLDVRGPFRLTRHPDNLPIIVLLWSFPRMTANRIALAAIATIHAILGSLHEDFRLRAAYGAAHARYARDVPFLLPALPAPGGAAPGSSLSGLGQG